MPVFDDIMSTPVSVSRCGVVVARSRAGRRRCPTAKRYGARTCEVGVALPWSMSIAAVSALNVEPGSYGVVNGSRPQ